MQSIQFIYFARRVGAARENKVGFASLLDGLKNKKLGLLA